MVLQIGQKPLYNINPRWIHRRTAGNVNPEVFFSAHLFQRQKGIGQSDQGDMMMPSLPGASLEMIQADFPLHFFIVLFNAEAPFCPSDQPPERSLLRRKTGKPVFPRSFIPLRPFDEQLFRWHFHRLALHQSIGRPDHHPSKTRSEGSFGPFSPCDLLPTVRRQVLGNLTKTPSGRKIFRVKAFSRDFPSTFHRRLSRMRIFCPSHQILAHLHYIIRPPASQPLTEFKHISIKRIRQNRANLQTPPFHFIDQIQSQLGLRFEGDFLGDPSLLPTNWIIDPFLWKIQRPIQRSTRFFCPQIQRHRYLTVGCLSQSTTVLSRHSHRMVSLLRKRHLINDPVSFGNKFFLHFSGQRRSHLLSRPGTLIHKLLQGLHIPIWKTIGHRLNGFTVSIHQEAANVFLGMLSPLFAPHGQNNISQEGLQLQPKSFDLSGFHTPKDIPMSS